MDPFCPEQIIMTASSHLWQCARACCDCGSFCKSGHRKWRWLLLLQCRQASPPLSRGCRVFSLLRGAGRGALRMQQAAREHQKTSETPEQDLSAEHSPLSGLRESDQAITDDTICVPLQLVLGQQVCESRDGPRLFGIEGTVQPRLVLVCNSIEQGTSRYPATCPGSLHETTRSTLQA